jgi:hypothetical protein
MHEHRSSLERMTSEPRLTLPARFELSLSRSGAQSDVTGENVVSGFVRFQPSTARAGDEDRANLHLSDICAREGKDHS